MLPSVAGRQEARVYVAYHHHNSRTRKVCDLRNKAIVAQAVAVEEVQTWMPQYLGEVIMLFATTARGTCTTTPEPLLLAMVLRAICAPAGFAAGATRSTAGDACADKLFGQPCLARHHPGSKLSPEPMSLWRGNQGP